MYNNLSAVFISHGGGPMPILDEAGNAEMLSCLKKLATDMPRPDVIIVVSAHWEESIATITAGASPDLIYDYHGFPKEAYEITYPCKGDPLLASEIHQLLSESGINATLDFERGFDHGVFIPLKVMYPEADIPCVQLSLLASLDPASHIAIGTALRGLSRKNVVRNILILGSGFSFHNLNAFFSPVTAQSHELNHTFEQWLFDTCGNAKYTEEERTKKLTHWFEAPGARFCHPREEHLLPLHVCYGASLIPCTKTIKLTIINKESSMYVW